MATKWLKRAAARDALGLADRTFARWVAKGLPRKGEGKREFYPWPEIQRWLLDHVREEGRESVRPEDYEDAKARKMMAEAELAELDLAIRRRELMTVDEGQKALSEAFDRIAAQLKAAPTRHAHDLVGIQTLPEAEARLKRITAEMMGDLAAAEDVPADAEPDEETADA